MTIQDDIDRFTQRIEYTEMLLEVCPKDDITYKKHLLTEYNCLLGQRARLIRNRGETL